MLTRPGVTTAPPRSSRSSASGGSPAPTSAMSPSSTQHPAALVLGAGVVHRDDPGVREDHTTSSGTSSKRSTSTRPRSVIFRLGITDSARNARCWNGDSSVHPSDARRRDERAARRPPRRAARPTAAPRPAAAARRAPRRRRPRRSRRRYSRAGEPRAAIDASFMPTTTTLCASCATVEAIAPRSQTEAAHEAEADPARSRGGARRPRSSRGRARRRRPPRRRAATAPRRATPSRSAPGRCRSRARCRPSTGSRNISRPEGADPHGVAHPVRHVGPRDLGARPARLQHESGTKLSRSGRTRRSAW